MKTIRQQMMELLAEKEMSARQLSQAVRIREKEVYEHLLHIAQTLSTKRKRLVIRPAQCLACGYVFQNRKRFTRPGRCPQCKKSYIQEPTYRIC